MGEGREGASMLNFTHSSISDWKNCNSNTNVPQTEQKFDKVNTEKMNLLPSLSRALCGTVIHANPTTFIVATDLTTKPETSRLLITCSQRVHFAFIRHHKYSYFCKRARGAPVII